MKEFDPLDNSASIVSVTDRVRPVAIGAAKRLAEALRAARGDNDLLYATALYILGDLHAFNHDYANAAETFLQELTIRQKAHASDDVQLSDPRSKIEAAMDYARSMSKLADSYWILGQDERAAKLRTSPQTRAGDDYRILDIDYVDRQVQNRTPLHPDHPSCLATMKSGGAR